MFSMMYLGSWPFCRLFQIISKFFVSLLIFYDLSDGNLFCNELVNIKHIKLSRVQ